jgi:hypothetical protein
MPITREYPNSILLTACVRIYTLSDKSGNIFYVGATSQQIEARLKQHLDTARLYGSTAKSLKIREINFQVIATIVDMVYVAGPWSMTPVSKAAPIEQTWIEHYRSLGYVLTNAPARNKYPAPTKDFINKKISHESCSPQP